VNLSPGVRRNREKYELVSGSPSAPLPAVIGSAIAGTPAGVRKSNATVEYGPLIDAIAAMSTLYGGEPDKEK
jgi:hypothetical protein